MVILYSYLKEGGNIIACIPFRYDIEDEETIESREIVLNVEPNTTYDAVKQEILNMLDKEKQEYGRETTDFANNSSVVTIG